MAFSDDALAELCDHGRLRKVYRVDLKKGDTDAAKEAEAFMLGTMALKGS